MQREAECERARGTCGADPLRYLLDALVDLATFRYRLRIDAALNALLGLGQGVKLRRAGRWPRDIHHGHEIGPLACTPFESLHARHIGGIVISARDDQSGCDEEVGDGTAPEP